MELARRVRDWLGRGIADLWRWKPPLARLEDLVRLAMAGEAPVESLDDVRGRLRPLALQVRDLLVELKSCKAQIAWEEQNLKHRLAQRTDALERLVGSLRAQANRDSLTGLFNRRMFDQHMPVLVERSVQEGRGLCVLALDVDHFKLLNDSLGHQTGDLFLRDIGQIIRSMIREDDMAFRIGGDEFLVALPEFSPEAGIALAKRLTTLIDSLGSVHRLDEKLGVSVGWASLASGSRGSYKALLEAADRRLYQCKSHRRRPMAA